MSTGAVDPRRFADNYTPDFGIDWTPVLPKEKLALMGDRQLVEYFQARRLADEWANKNRTGSGWVLPSWRRVMQNWKRYKIIIILGGNRCVRGDTPIYDPVLNATRRIDSIRGPHHVLAWDGEGLVVAEAEEPFTKPAGAMLRVTLSTGEVFVAALEHRVLSAQGEWLSLAQLRPGCALLRPTSTLGAAPSDQASGARHSFETPSGFQPDYHAERRLCDEQPQWEEGIDQDGFPLLNDVPKHISGGENIARWLALRAYDSQQRNLGVLGRIFSRIPVWNQLYRLSTLDDIHQRAVQYVDRRSHASCTPCKSVWPSHGNPVRHEADLLFTAGSPHSQSTTELTQRGTESNRELAYVVSVLPEGIDVKWDMTVPAHGNYWAAGAIHHNSAKTELASRLCVWALGTIPEAEIRCYDVNQDYSKQRQQKYINDALPEALKNLPTKRGINHAISYRQGQGFTNDQLILPPLEGWTKGGQIDFVHYSQYTNNPKTAEGWRAQIVWCDEPPPTGLFETLPYRLSDFHGRLIVTFTTLDGWTPLIADILGKVRTLEWRHSDLVNKKLPVWQESTTRADMGIFYFWTTDNPWANPDQFRLNLKGRPTDEILARAHGIPTKAAKAAFPLFSRDVNVVKHEDLPFVKKPDYECTRYMIMDPGGSKNDYVAWVAIDVAGTHWVYREWPDFQTYGAWAESGSTPDGKAGPAQNSLGYGFSDMAELIRSLESGEEIFERLIDPRMGAAEHKGKECATTIISDYETNGLTFVPAPGLDRKHGIKKINELLSFKADKPRDSKNSPKLYISDRCENFIHMMCEYTNCSPTEHYKEAPDLLRYLLTSGAQYFSKADQMAHGTTGSY